MGGANAEVLRERGLAGSAQPSDPSRWQPWGGGANGRRCNTESEINPGTHRGCESLGEPGPTRDFKA